MSWQTKRNTNVINYQQIPESVGTGLNLNYSSEVTVCESKRTTKRWFWHSSASAEPVVFRSSKICKWPKQKLLLYREVSDWSSILAFLLNVGFSSLKTNYIKETLSKIFCKAHFSHYPCQWISNWPVIWDSLFYILYPFWNNLNSQMKQKHIEQ